MRHLFKEPDRDPRLGAALRGAESFEPGLTDDELGRRILQAARPVLARLRPGTRPPSWWEWTAVWARLAVPIGLAAGLGAILLAGAGTSRLETAWATDSVTVTETMLAAAASPAPAESQVADLLIAPATDEWLLNGALTQ